MKKLLILFIFVCQSLFAQYNELGLFAGGSNVVADIGAGTYINPNKLVLGLVYKRNLHKRLSVRADVKWMDISDNDQHSSIEARHKRNWSFDNRLTELGLGIEYHFLEFDTHEPFDVLFTPYFHTGIYRIGFNSLQMSTLHQVGQRAKSVDDRRIWSWAVPFGLGVKTRLGQTRFLIGAEIGLRYTFTNNLEGSFPNEASLRFGNLNNNDWYFVSGIYLTYTFGKRDCQCF